MVGRPRKWYMSNCGFPSSSHSCFRSGGQFCSLMLTVRRQHWRQKESLAWTHCLIRSPLKYSIIISPIAAQHQLSRSWTREITGSTQNGGTFEQRCWVGPGTGAAALTDRSALPGCSARRTASQAMAASWTGALRMFTCRSPPKVSTRVFNNNTLSSRTA